MWCRGHEVAQGSAELGCNSAYKYGIWQARHLVCPKSVQSLTSTSPSPKQKKMIMKDAEANNMGVRRNDVLIMIDSLQLLVNF